MVGKRKPKSKHSRYSRTPVACTNCRRAKVKCDGKKPCSRCIKRHESMSCQYICRPCFKRRSIDISLNENRSNENHISYNNINNKNNCYNLTKFNSSEKKCEDCSQSISLEDISDPPLNTVNMQRNPSLHDSRPNFISEVEQTTNRNDSETLNNQLPFFCLAPEQNFGMDSLNSRSLSPSLSPPSSELSSLNSMNSEPIFETSETNQHYSPNLRQQNIRNNFKGQDNHSLEIAKIREKLLRGFQKEQNQKQRKFNHFDINSNLELNHSQFFDNEILTKQPRIDNFSTLESFSSTLGEQLDVNENTESNLSNTEFQISPNGNQNTNFNFLNNENRNHSEENKEMNQGREDQMLNNVLQHINQIDSIISQLFQTRESLLRNYQALNSLHNLNSSPTLAEE